jgi:hypothetical protein
MTVFEAWSAGRAERKTRAVRSPVLTRVVRWLAGHTPPWSRARSTVLQVTALGLLDYAAFEWHHLVGYVAIGVSLLVFEALGGER